MESIFSIPLYNHSRIAKFHNCRFVSSEDTIKIQGKPNLDKADWNKVENAWDELWSSAFILICDLADDVLIIHSTRYIDAASAF